MNILAIETSCDETAAAVIRVNRLPITKNRKEKTVNSERSTVNILSNVVASQIPLHQKYGGVFPEIASRAHSEKIIEVVQQSIKGAGLSLSEVPVSRFANGEIETRTGREAESEKISQSRLPKIDLIAVTNGPGLIGSLLVGTTFAKTLSYANNIPIVGINHLLGHIYANWAKKPHPQFPALILIVSGGHTGLYLMKSHCDIKTLGETLDDAAGEAFDKVAKILDLGYPGGPAISKIAKDGDPITFNFPRSMLDRDTYDFSFSGLKTSVLYESMKHKLTKKLKADMAASFEQAVIDILIGKTIQASRKYKPKSICLCGGVSANQNLREQFKYNIDLLNSKTQDLSSKISFHCPPFELTTDNAAMIGLAAAYQTQTCNLKPLTYSDITTDSNLKL